MGCMGTPWGHRGDASWDAMGMHGDAMGMPHGTPWGCMGTPWDAWRKAQSPKWVRCFLLTRPRTSTPSTESSVSGETWQTACGIRSARRRDDAILGHHAAGSDPVLDLTKLMQQTTPRNAMGMHGIIFLQQAHTPPEMNYLMSRLPVSMSFSTASMNSRSGQTS